MTAPPGTPPLIELLQVSGGFPEREVLRGVDFSLYPGERVALIGANGAGKSTFLHLLVGLHRARAGELRLFGAARRTEADFVPVRAQVGLVFQQVDDQLFCPTVLEDVAFGPLNLGRSPSEARADAERTLAALGLDGFAERVTYRLSAGEKRLVALATVLAMQPQVLLLDEPTTGLDHASEARLLDHLDGLDQAMVIVSHDQAVLERLATRAVGLEQGRMTDLILHRHDHSHAHTHWHARPHA
jgi:cobalt/nickel transport system ATP-binding protein